MIAKNHDHQKFNENNWAKLLSKSYRNTAGCFARGRWPSTMLFWETLYQRLHATPVWSWFRWIRKYKQISRYAILPISIVKFYLLKTKWCANFLVFNSSFSLPIINEKNKYSYESSGEYLIFWKFSRNFHSASCSFSNVSDMSTILISTNAFKSTIMPFFM